jgi:phosphohistidine phosphatase
MKKLLLIRHSVANPAYREQRDIERELTEGGAVRAMQLANFFKNSNLIPDAIYTSEAIRALQTSNYLAEKLLSAHQSLQVSEDIYESSVRIMVGLITKLPAGQKTVFIVGHNPILQYVGEYLSGESLDTLEPGGYYTLSLNGKNWEEVSQGSLKFEATVTPATYAIV